MRKFNGQLSTLKDDAPPSKRIGRTTLFILIIVIMVLYYN